MPKVPDRRGIEATLRNRSPGQTHRVSFYFEKELVRTLSKDQKTGKKVYYANRERTLLLLDPRLSCKDALKKAKRDWKEMSPEEHYNFLKDVYASMTACEMKMAQMQAEASAEVEPGRSELGERRKDKAVLLAKRTVEAAEEGRAQVQAAAGRGTTRKPPKTDSKSRRRPKADRKTRKELKPEFREL